MGWLFRWMGRRAVASIATFTNWVPAWALRWGKNMVRGMLDSEGVKYTAKAHLWETAIEAEARARIANLELLKLEHGWVWSRWIRPGFAYITMFWYGAVVADSLFHFNWEPTPLPFGIQDWMGWIIGSYFIGRSFEKIVRLWKK